MIRYYRGAISIHICGSAVIKMMNLGSNGWEEPQIYGQYATSFNYKEYELNIVVPYLEWDD